MTTFATFLASTLGTDIENDLLNYCRIGNSSDSVFKEECCLSFETSESEDGVFTSLKNFNCFSKSAVTENGYYLNILSRKELKEEFAMEDGDSPPTPPQKLAINVEGGYQDDSKKYKTIMTYKLVFFETSSGGFSAVDEIDATKSIADLSASEQFSALHAKNSQVIEKK